MPETPSVATLAHHLALTEDGIVAGFVASPADPGRRFVVDLVVDGLPVAVLRACAFWDGDPPLDVGDGCHAFFWPMPAGLVERACVIEARLANTDVLVGRLDRAEDSLPHVPAVAWRGEARWVGGLTIRGWVPRPEGDAAPHVTAWMEGRIAAETACRDWITVERDGRREAVPAFTLHLPDQLADNRARSVDIIGPDGRPLRGSPVAFVAFADRLAAQLDSAAVLDSERIRARFADGLLPQSLPFSAVLPWLARGEHVALPPAPAPARVAVLLAGPGDVATTAASLALAADGAATRIVHLGDHDTPGWSFAADALDRCAAAMSDVDLVIVTVAGARLRPGAAARFDNALRRVPAAVLVYADILLEGDGDPRPVAFPAFDRERWAEQGYAAFLFALRPKGLRRAAAARSRTLFALFEAQLAGDPASAPVHVPRILAHLPALPVTALSGELARLAADRQDGTAALPAAAGPLLPRVRIARPIRLSTVTAVVATQGADETLAETLASLRRARTPATLDVVVVHNGGDALDGVEAEATRTVSVPGWFVVPHLLNRGAAVARGEALLFVRPGVTMSDPGWLDELIGRAGPDDAGAVSPVVVDPTGVIAHAGYVVGPPGGVIAAHRDRLADDAGYAGLLRSAHECSAVAAACLLTKRTDFERIGGFDALHLPLHLWDVDYCLRLRAGGQRIILTPHARAYAAAVAAGPVPSLDPFLDPRLPTRTQELSRLRQRWGLATGADPFYSPWLNRDGSPYAGLNWFAEDIPFRTSAQPAPRPIVEGL